MNRPFRAIIFVTGGAIIALELLASRIMTPYFGVSLYIWTGILSITLIALALGYYGGGILAREVTRQRRHLDDLTGLFLLMPAIASLGLAGACLIYPWAFYAFAAVHLVVGAFSACMVLLFIPLVTTSAMNPLLVAIENAAPPPASGREPVGDAGAGRILFISTAGSVAGVLVTAFALIPHLSNYTSALLVGAILGAITLGAPFVLPHALRHRRRLAAAGGAALTACLALLAASDFLLGASGTVRRGTQVWQIEQSYTSLFGSVKVLRAAPADAPERAMRYFYQDGIVQNRVDAQGISQTLFTYALEAIAMGYRPAAKSALMLGLGAGIVPMRLAERGVAVEIVEINPASWAAAEAHFGFQPRRFKNHLADARSFVRACAVRGVDERHDIVLVDLFQGDGTPEYLITREFFADLKSCLKPGGIAVFNTFADLGHLRAYAHLLVTLKAEYATVMVFRGEAPPDAQVNSFLLATNGPTGRVARLDVPNLPTHLDEDMRWALGRPRLIDSSDLAGGQIVTDAANFLPSANAATYLAYRRSVIGAFPRQFLVN